MFRPSSLFLSAFIFLGLSPMNLLLAADVSPAQEQASKTNDAPAEVVPTVNETPKDPVKATQVQDGAYFVTTLAGSPLVPGSADGTGNFASFVSLHGVAVDASGNVYVVDASNNVIRKITAKGVVTTLAGSAGVTGTANGTGSAASFKQPSGIAVDASGDLYVADRGNNVIRKITSEGVVTTLAGSGLQGVANGKAKDASFNEPMGVAVDTTGNVYVADYGNHRIRKIDLDGMVTTLAGGAVHGGFADGKGPAASFSGPMGVAVDTAGNVYVADTYNNEIRKITPEGMVTTLAGVGSFVGTSKDGLGTKASFGWPAGIAVDPSGNIFVADESGNKIRKITPEGVVTTLAGTGTSGYEDGKGIASSFTEAFGIALDATGTIYVAQLDEIRKIQLDKNPNESVSVEIKNGKKAEAAKDKAQAKMWYLKAAGKGSAVGQYQLAQLYANDNLVITTAAMASALWAKGHPLVQNDPLFSWNAAQMLRWTRISANQGYAPAEELLGEIYAGEQNTVELGDIVTKVDQAEAANWYQKAAAQGDRTAKQKLKALQSAAAATAVPASASAVSPALTGLLEKAHKADKAKNYKSAMKWFEKAADQGNAEAEYKIGTMYDHGRAVAKDPAVAFVWYKKAADQGYAAAEDAVGNYYWTGAYGVTKDLAQAELWFKKACDQNDMGACTSLAAMYYVGK